MIRPNNPVSRTTPYYILRWLDFIGGRLQESTGQELILKKVEEINSSNSFTYFIDAEARIEDAPYIRTDLNLLDYCDDYLNMLGDGKGESYNWHLDNIDAYLDCDIALYELMTISHDLIDLYHLTTPVSWICFSLNFKKKYLIKISDA